MQQRGRKARSTLPWPISLSGARVSRPPRALRSSGSTCPTRRSWIATATGSVSPAMFPFTRGAHPTMYRSRLWTMREYAGYSTAEESNRRYRYLLSQGSTGLSIAFDLPTQIGLDSDHPLCVGRGRQGRRGDQHARRHGGPLRGHPARQGLDVDDHQRPRGHSAGHVRRRSPKSRASIRRRLRGTIQNDILKEYIARGTYIFPPRPSLRLIENTFEYCSRNVPHWNTISISGYHIREAGATAVQELAFTLADAICYIETALKAGLHIDDFAPRLAFFFAAHTDFFEEVAKFRARTRLYSRIMKERFGATKRREHDAAVSHPDRAASP